MSITLEAVQQLVDQLSPLDQVRLIAYLTQRIAPALETVQAPASTAEQADDAWTNLESFWQEIEHLGTSASSATEQLLADRRNRQNAIEGSDHAYS